MALSACASHSDDPQAPEPQQPSMCAISFYPDAQSETESRAEDKEIAESLGNRFAIFAWKTTAKGTTQYVLSKDETGKKPYIVSYTPALGWDYASPADQFLKYWDLSAQKYTFYALANYPDSRADFSTTFSEGKASISGVDAADPKAAMLMESYYERDGQNLADFDLLGLPTAAYYRPTARDTIPAYADIVPLPFHYLLSRVQFKIYNKAPQHGPSIPISHVTIKIYGSDGYYTTADYTNPDFAYNGAKTCDFTDSDLTDAYIQSSKNNALTLYSGVVMPQPLTSVIARVTITTDAGMLSGTVKLDPGWDRGKIYIYYLYTEYTEDYILVDTVEIDDWTPTTPPIENTQTNW